jgi:UDP-GlcNAc:undecaprenyl-phosphate/decaprenyl-phosphate GlcNAc-1-phosphate transferase
VIEPRWAVFLLALTGAAAEVVALALLLADSPVRLRTANYRGRPVIGRGGITLAAPLLMGAFWAWVADLSDLALLAAIGAPVAFGLLGWLDDEWGDAGARGMKGHFASLVKQGRVTTGLVKALGGSVVGLGAACALGVRGWALLPAGALVATSANALNALDTRPGRAVKTFVAVGLVVLGVACVMPLGSVMPVLASLVAGAVVFAWADLTERTMLGDTGSNALGAALGVGIVSVTAWPAWLALSVGLLLFCLAADRWSLGGLIESTRFLRWLDQLGRPRELTTGRRDGS